MRGRGRGSGCVCDDVRRCLGDVSSLGMGGGRTGVMLFLLVFFSHQNTALSTTRALDNFYARFDLVPNLPQGFCSSLRLLTTRLGFHRAAHLYTGNARTRRGVEDASLPHANKGHVDV